MLLAQSDGGEVLALGLSTQAKPERSVGWKNLRLGFRHRGGIFQSLPRHAIFSTHHRMLDGGRAGFYRLNL